MSWGLAMGDMASKYEAVEEAVDSPRQATHEGVGAEFSRRLRMAIGDQTIFRFAQECGLSDTLVRKYLEGSMPGLEKLIELARATGVRVGWLATGEPPIYEGVPPRVNQLLPDAAGPDTSGSGFVLIPWYDPHTGWEQTHLTPKDETLRERLAFRRQWLESEGLDAESLVLVSARGDSMEPTLVDGDLLLVHTRERELADDGIYVLRLDHFVVAKRLQKNWTGGFWIRSDSPLYEDQFVGGDAVAELQIVGRVVWMARRV